MFLPINTTFVPPFTFTKRDTDSLLFVITKSSEFKFYPITSIQDSLGNLFFVAIAKDECLPIHFVNNNNVYASPNPLYLKRGVTPLIDANTPFVSALPFVADHLPNGFMYEPEDVIFVAEDSTPYIDYI